MTNKLIFIVQFVLIEMIHGYSYSYSMVWFTLNHYNVKPFKDIETLSNTNSFTTLEFCEEVYPQI